MTKEYEFDASPIVIQLNIAEINEDPRYVVHILNKPTKEQIVKYEQKTKLEQFQVTPTVMQDDNDVLTAFYWLYDQIIQKITSKPIKDISNFTVDDPRLEVLTPERVALIHPIQKMKCIQAIHDVSFELTVDEDVDEVFMGGFVKGKMKFNNGMGPDIPMTFADPSESQRKRFQKIWTTQRVGGSKHNRVRNVTDIRIADELFDQTIRQIDKGTVEGKLFDNNDQIARKKFLNQIDPSHKLTCLASVMNRINANAGK